jgi:uncharacterized membrane protein YdjX (TVP38/TMEM64 family)
LSFIDRIPFSGRFQSGLELMEKSMQDKGVWWVAALRNAPVAPFVVVNMAVGSTPLRFFDFLIGNALGVLPTILAIIFFEEKVVAAVDKKDFSIALPALLVLAILYFVSAGARNLLGKSSESQ